MILCFSGTGNSLYAARLISAAAGDEVVSLNALLRGGGPARFSSERPYVVVSPTHGWRLPAAVEALLRRAAWEGSRRMYFFLTCGSEPGDAAKYCRLVYEAGFSPICPLLFLPLFLKDSIPQEHKDGIDMARDYLRRASVLVVCGGTVDEAMKNDIAVAERLRITATTLDGILTVKGQGREDGGKKGA